MGTRNRVSIVSIVPLVIPVAFIAVFFAVADAGDAVIRITEPGLEVSLAAVPPTAEAPATIQLRGSIKGGTPPYTYTLRFGDGRTENGTTNTGKVVTDHKYVNPGTYRASLSAKDVNGLTGTSATTRGVSSLITGKGDDTIVGVERAPEEREAVVKAEPIEEPARRRSWRFWRRRRKTPEEVTPWEESPKVVAGAEEKPALRRRTPEEATPREERPEIVPEVVAETEEKPARRRSWRFWRRRRRAPEEVAPREEKPEVVAGAEEKPARRWRAPEEVASREEKPKVVAEAEMEPEAVVKAEPVEKPARRRSLRFWRRRRKAPEKEVEPEEEKPKVVAGADDVELREAFSQSLEERIAMFVNLEAAEKGRPGVSGVLGVETPEPGAQYRRLAPAVESGLWPKTWELDFEYEPPRRVIVKSDWKADAGEPYWYMVYRITNSGEKPIKLSMDVELRTERGVFSEVYSPRTLRVIRAREKRKKLASFMDLPKNLEPAASIEAVAIFSNVTNETTDYKFAISGLNNTYRVEGEKFTMFRRVLVIFYERLGDEFQVEYDLRKRKDVGWIEEEFSGK